MHLTNYSGRKYLVEVVGDRVLLDGFLVATLTKTYDGEGSLTDMAREFKECILKENDKVWQK